MLDASKAGEHLWSPVYSRKIMNHNGVPIFTQSQQSLVFIFIFSIISVAFVYLSLVFSIYIFTTMTTRDKTLILKKVILYAIIDYTKK